MLKTCPQLDLAGFRSPIRRVSRTRFKITAASLYEAAILGLAELRRCAMVEDAPGPAAKFTIAVESPSTVHEVPMQKLTAWLESNGKSPAEQALKVRLREALRR
jgi:hypothetical protein